MSTDSRSTTTGPAETPASGSDAPASGSPAPGTSGMSGTPEVPGSAADPPRSSRAWVLPVVTAVAGLLGLVAALLMPFAPVIDKDTTVTWPQAGRQTASTTAFFVPYAPEAVRVDVPCPVLRAAAGRSGPATVVSSDPVGADSNGFTVTTAGGDTLVLVGGRQVYRAPLPPGDDCGLVLTADDAGATLRVGDAPPRAFPGDRVRSVHAFATDLSPADAAGLRVQARTADWFTADATGTKTALATVQLLLAAASLVLLALADRSRRRRRPSGSTRRLLRARLAAALGLRGLTRALVDVGVLAVLAVWTVLGPLSPDDGFTEGIVRNAAGTDAFTNYYRWENASEAPFTLVLRLVQPLVDAGTSPLGLRVLSSVAGFLVWVLLARVALPVLLPRHARRTAVRLLLAFCLLAWWMPFDLGVRPEPFAALAVTATVAFALRAVRSSRHGHTWLGLAALAFGTSVAVTPSSIMVVGPVLVLLPGLVRRLRGEPGRAGAGLAVAAGTCAAAALAGVGLVLMFTGQSWFTVTRSTEMHAFYGPDVPWFQEIRRYDYLLSFDDLQGGLGRRVPVLITIALLVALLPLLARGVHRAVGLPRAPVVVAGTALGLLALWLTPSKWSHYFGTLAGPGAAALATGVVLLVLAARRRTGDAVPVRAAAAAGTLALVIAASVAFAGKNDWFLYSHWGVPHDDGPFRPLNTPLPWAALVVLLLAGAVLVGRLRPGTDVRTAVRRAVVAVPAVLTTVVAVTAVAVLLWSFATAPGRQQGSYSVGAQMTAELDGRPNCGILDQAVTVTDAPGGPLGTGPGTDDNTGFQVNGGYQGTPPDPPGTGNSTYLWGSRNPGTLSTGSLTTRWFVLPALRDGQELALDVAGRTGQGNRLAVEFAPPGDGTAPPLGTRVLDDSDTDPDYRPDYPSDRVEEQAPLDRPEWRSVHLPASQVPRGAGLVRIRATDATTDPGGWLAVTGPRVRDLAPARAVIRDSDSVFVDWSILWAAPCLRNNPRVADGLARTPDVLLRGPVSIGFAGDASFVPGIGGGFAGMRLVDREEIVQTRLNGTDDRPRYADWGQIVRVTYPFARDAYDRSSVGVRRWGWEGDRTPLGYPEKPAP